ncbi:uncharacterized protein UTRI_03877_B [Ustilago trichophora]|uniref:Uncharacterized protein n=1 Tax=Ustilago trichophora TaxID=86804 RepID=A0A5C3E1Y0_9BASI|nr:uncharacterized protein UTRI_03877_B [Ustilago trichophora]
MSDDTSSPLHSRPALSDIKNVVGTTKLDDPHSARHSKQSIDEPSARSSLRIRDADLRASSLREPESLTPSTSADDLDHAWLGGLERYELEQLLIEASRKVREREQKLVVAANIGKALLEKNLTLRSGIMTSMASSSSLFGLTDIEAMINDVSETHDITYMHDLTASGADVTNSSPHPMNSPPTTDIDIHSQGQISPARAESDTTPLAHPVALPLVEPDYFNRPANSTTQPHHAKTLATVEASAPATDASIWVPSDAGLIVSQPCSPSASISSFASHSLLSPLSTMSRITSKRNPNGTRHRSRPSLLQLQALEAQRQLASLGEQNEVLHQQISELQYEAETARCEGSKRLGRLNKEIRGLKAELEAATRRNVELETNRFPNRPSSASRSPIQSLVMRHRPEPPSPLLIRSRRLQDSSDEPLPPAPLPALKDEPTSDHHGLLPSTSNLEDMVRSAQTTAGESALLAQLLAKIKELEETNSAMAKAEEDFGSRMGRAMEEDERLRDAFNTVGQDLGVETAASTSWPSPNKAQDPADLLSNLGPSKIVGLQPGFITPSHSLHSLDSLASADAPSLISPSHKRRAPGNRHVIEHRKTVRSAIRRAKKELAAEIWGINSDEPPASGEHMSRSSTEQSLGTYSIDLSGNSSAASSPRPRGLNRKASSNSLALGPAGRPRIRITPSIEDLGRRRKMQEEVIAGPPPESSPAADWQDIASPTAPTFQHHDSLSPSDAMQAYSSRLRKSLGRSHTEQDRPARLRSEASDTPSLGDGMTPYLSPSHQKAFKPTARVRRSRSRSSSFGSDARFGYSTSPIQQSPDPFMSSSLAWDRPKLQRSPTSASSHRGRTLGSELGSIFGGDDRKHDFDDDLPQGRRPTSTELSAAQVSDLQPLVLRSISNTTALELRSKMMAGLESDRPTANVGRLVPENSEEQEDDLECVLAQSVHNPVEDVFLDDSPLRPRDAALLARVEAEDRGAWLADQPIIESGGLQDEDEPRGAQFDLINAIVEQQAVAWADDDDYGRTISQREAVKLGLLAPSASPLAGRSVRLLKDNKPKRGSSLFGMTRSTHSKNQKPLVGKKEATPFRLEIESSEQVEHRLRIESLLRRRRQDLLRERGFADEWELDAQDQEQEDQLIATYAPTPQRLQEKRRRGLVGGRSDGWLTSPRDASPSGRDPHQSTQQWVRDLACVSPMSKRTDGKDADEDEDHDYMGLDRIRPEDGEFELIDCPSWKKQGGRGTDYFPTSFRARYRPAMVKQRVVHVSQVTYGWVEEWVQFAFVVFLAFVVMVEQGPNRNARRGKPNATAPPSLMNKQT